jgi:RNA exonuclease 1
VIGHSAENDLRCLRIIHRKVMDTALLYRHPKGPHMKPSLKNLSRIYLSEVIQESSHDSIIDATSAMKLAKLKLNRGHELGYSDINEPSKIMLFDLLSKSKKLTGVFDESYAIKKLDSSNVSAFPCKNDKETVERTCKVSHFTCV